MYCLYEYYCILPINHHDFAVDDDDKKFIDDHDDEKVVWRWQPTVGLLRANTFCDPQMI